MVAVRGKSRSVRREGLLALLYLSELTHEAPHTKLAFESGNFDDEEVKLIENLALDYARLVKLVSQNLAANWTYERLAALERAILIWGAFELTFNPAGLVIDELVNYAKNYIPGAAYKYLNKVLDNINQTYERTKKSLPPAPTA